MFDFGFSELALIGAVALVVLGPEKLPIVARTAGEWVGKAQRMVQQVKNDIEREAEMSELKKIKEEAQSVADDLNSTVKGHASDIENSMNSIKSDVNTSAQEMTDSFNAIAKDAQKKAGNDVGNNPNTNGVTTSASDDEYIPDPSEDFYEWYGSEISNDDDKDKVKTTFEKRYKAGPSIDELAEQIEKLKAELGDRSPRFGGNNRRLCARARSNRIRIYR